MNTRMDLKAITALNADHIVVATGIVPRRPAIEGSDGPNVLSYVDVLNGAQVGKRVAIIGAGGIGFDVAEFLLHPANVSLPVSVSTWFDEWGIDALARERGGLKPPVPAEPIRQIWLLQRKAGKLGASLGKTSGWVHRATLVRNRVTMLAGVTYRAIDASGLRIERDGATQHLEVDTIVICAGQESLRELYPADSQMAPRGSKPSASGRSTQDAPTFHLIGGARLAGELDAKRAIREGAECANKL